MGLIFSFNTDVKYLKIFFFCSRGCFNSPIMRSRISYENDYTSLSYENDYATSL